MATAIMKQKEVPEMDDVEKIISKIWLMLQKIILCIMML